jgi:hypothetical protein
MKHLEINRIKNKSDDWGEGLIDENKQYISTIKEVIVE